MSSLRIVLLATAGLTLAACDRYMAERYLPRRDTVTSGAGNAVATNSALQIPTPWPRGSQDTNIAFDGEKLGNAVRAYKEDKEFLREQEIDKVNIGRGEPGAGAAAEQGAGGGVAAAGPPPGAGPGAAAPSAGYGDGTAPGP
ncbi:MAG: hypothetical protein ACT4O2_04190 [Beijerinckiaceae bacterium]